MWTVARVLMVTLVAPASGLSQVLPAPENLQQAMEDIEYAELLNAAQLTPEQVEALLDMQSAIQAEMAIEGELAVALPKALAALLSGATWQEALGQQMALVTQAQQRLQQTLEQSDEQLRQLLTEEQEDALVWASSPARELSRAADMFAKTRDVPDERWDQFKMQMCQGFAQMFTQANQGQTVAPEQVVAVLDEMRALDDATFEAKRATLAQEWLPVLLPKVAEMLQTPEWREQQTRHVCRRLLTYERGKALVEAKRDAMATQ